MRALSLLGLLLLCSIAQGQTAAFVKADTTTQGNWTGTYGHDGAIIVAGQSSIPPYVKVIEAGEQTYTWASTTTDARAPINAAPGPRIAATWYSGTSFVIDVNISDGQTHQLALYALDWDSYNGIRQETVSITNGNGSVVLDTQKLTNYVNGTYLVWNVSGHVQALITKTAGANATISGVFFDPPGGAAVTPPVPPVICACVHSVVLAWMAVPGAAHYNVLRGTTMGGPYVVIGQPVSATYTDTLVTAGASYYYVTQTVSNAGTSGNSAEIPVTIPSP